MTKRKIGLAFQGGIFPAGAMGAGVVRRLEEEGVFDRHSEYDLHALSGTSSGALVATTCWMHQLLNTMEDAPRDLENLWMYVANGLIPNAETAGFCLWLDQAWAINPLYSAVKDAVGVPWMRHMFTTWVKRFLRLGDIQAALRDPSRRPRPAHLLLGSTDVLKGDITYFHLGSRDVPRRDHNDITYFNETDFLLDPVLASGSYVDINGFTTISSHGCHGTFCDGAWGTNPPLAPLIDCGVDEIWLVEAFPKLREEVPRTHSQREDRKEELWQNSLVEHELHMIDRVNRWLAAGVNLPNKRHIIVKRMPMILDLPYGSTLVNSPTFIRQMIGYGRASAGIFIGSHSEPTTQTVSAPSMAQT